MKIMKNLIIALIAMLFVTQLTAQELPKDVEKVYSEAEKLKSKGDYDQAIKAYKEVIRSVKHVPSMISIGDIEMTLKPRPNYRNAAEYYTMAVEELGNQINLAPKKGEKKKLAELREQTVPKMNKAQSYTDDFDNAKEKRSGGSRLMEDEDEDDE
jgi:tetratricopeptide (TPR) repeat protein